MAVTGWTRYASKAAICKICDGARCLKCSAAKAGMVAALGQVSAVRDKAAAVIATRSAMLDVQIITLCSHGRDKVTKNSRLSDFSKGLKGVPSDANGAWQTAKETTLNEYVKSLEAGVSLQGAKVSGKGSSALGPVKEEELDVDAGTLRS